MPVVYRIVYSDEFIDNHDISYSGYEEAVFASPYYIECEEYIAMVDDESADVCYVIREE